MHITIENSKKYDAERCLQLAGRLSESPVWRCHHDLEESRRIQAGEMIMRVKHGEAAIRQE